MSKLTPAAALRQRRQRLRNALKHLAHEPQDVHAVHDARVAVRRMAAALRWLEQCKLDSRAHKLRRRLNVLRRSLGPLRDAQVLLEQLDAWALTSEGRSTAALEWLRRRTAARVQRATARMQADIAALDRDKLNAALKRLERRLAQGDVQAQRAALAAAIAAAATGVAIALAAVRPSRAPTWHALRIAVKHLRYTLELAADAAWPQLARRAETFKDWQERLGIIQDLSVSIDAFATLAAAPDPPAGASTWVRRLRRERRTAIDAAQRDLPALEAAVAAAARFAHAHAATADRAAAAAK